MLNMNKELYILWYELCHHMKYSAISFNCSLVQGYQYGWFRAWFLDLEMGLFDLHGIKLLQCVYSCGCRRLGVDTGVIWGQWSPWWHLVKSSSHLAWTGWWMETVMTAYSRSPGRCHRVRHKTTIHGGSQINPYNAEIFLYKPNHEHQRGFLQFEIIINVLFSSFWFIWIPMLWVYGHYKYFNSFSAGIVFIRQNLTSVDVIFWRIKMVPALKGFMSLQQLNMKSQTCFVIIFTPQN